MTQVSFGNHGFQSQGLMGRSRRPDWEYETWKYGRIKHKCEKCGREVLRLFEGKCGTCFAEDYVEKHPVKKDKLSPGRKIRL